MNLSITHSAVATGEGKLTAKDLAQVVHSVPPEAVIKVTMQSTQRDGSSWTVEASWDGVAQANWDQSTQRKVEVIGGNGRRDS